MADGEPAQALWRFLEHMHPFDLGSPGPAMAKPDKAIDGLGITLEDRLDAAVGVVTHPSRHLVHRRPPPEGVAEENALNAALDQDAPAHGGHR